jgi:tetratricopeptide (TPR) repeat protein
MGRWLVVFGLLALGSVAQAQAAPGEQAQLDEEARELFEAGQRAYTASRYEAAVGYFQQAYELSHRAQLLFNIGSCYDRLQQNARAVEAYRAYLAAMPQAENRASVERRIEFLARNERPPEDVATPREAAESTMPSEPAPADAPAEPSGDVTGEWWFWTLIAVLVVGAGAGITAGVLLGSPGTQEPVTGDFRVVMALGGP